MIDLHTHLLPGMDDGAKDTEMSLAMLAMQRESGVDKIVLTPHFDLRSETPEQFVSRRDAAFSLLRAAIGDSPAPALKLGAEVRYTPDLLKIDLAPLTLGGGDYLLLELSAKRHPTMLDYGIGALLDRGIIPILAHVERYPYFHTDPEELTDLIAMGALAQVSAEAVMGKKHRSFTHICLKNDVVQMIASDAHNDTDRKPDLAQARGCVPAAIWSRSQAFAQSVWDNEDTPVPCPKCPNTFFCKNL